MTKKGEYKIDSPYAGLIEFTKPKGTEDQKAQMQKLARLNALTEAFRILGEGVYGARGATIVPRQQPQQTSLYALNRFMQLSDLERQEMQNWRNLAMEVAVQDQRIKESQTFQEKQAERQREFSAEEAKKTRGFRSEETEKGREFQKGQTGEQREFQTERDKLEHKRRSELLEKEVEAYKGKQKFVYSQREEEGNVKIKATGEMIDAKDVGTALGLIREKYNEEKYTTKDSLLKNFLKDERSVTFDEKSELINRYWDDIKDNFSEQATETKGTEQGNEDMEHIRNIWNNSKLGEDEKYDFTLSYIKSAMKYDENRAKTLADMIKLDYRQSKKK